MNFDVMVNGRPWKVALEPADAGAMAGRVTATIKGKSRVLDALWIDADTLSLIDASAAVHEIRLHPRGNGAVGVETRGKLFDAVVSKQTAGALGARGASGAVGATGLGFSHAIKAPMPGRVVRVLVAVGEHVTARQAVVVIEAMKMENELRTPRDGTVKEIAVAPGAVVESGAVLVVIGE